MKVSFLLMLIGLYAGAAQATAARMIEEQFEEAALAAIGGSVSPDILVRQVREKVFSYDAQIYAECKNRRMVRWDRLKPVDDPLTQSYRRRGAEQVVRQRVWIDGCSAAERAYNLLVLTPSDKSLAPVLTNGAPGMTETLPYLQYNVQRFFIAYMTSKVGGLCARKLQQKTTQAIITDTQIGRQVEALTRNAGGDIVQGAWTEEWRGIICGQTVKADILLSAEGDGQVLFGLAGRRPARALADLRRTAKEGADKEQ